MRPLRWGSQQAQGAPTFLIVIHSNDVSYAPRGLSETQTSSFPEKVKQKAVAAQCLESASSKSPRTSTKLTNRIPRRQKYSFLLFVPVLPLLSRLSKRLKKSNERILLRVCSDFIRRRADEVQGAPHIGNAPQSCGRLSTKCFHGALLPRCSAQPFVCV